MIDKPGKRRINQVPVPRGGGLALYLGVIGSFMAYAAFINASVFPAVGKVIFWRLVAVGGLIAALGFADDRFSLRPKVKLSGQLALAALAWWWGELSFNLIWPEIPVALDAALVIFWLVGAMNAFNLIDGLDGLASGLALIAVLGMAGAMVFTGNIQSTFFYFAFAGGLLGFLRYNYNPASVFLGDCGSMYIGYTLAVLPLCSRVGNSFLVSVGVPLLAMGVPIFDTALAILRRSLRRLLLHGSASGEVMSADADHLHHRILRSVGLSQKKAAWALYALAIALVVVGLVGVSLESRAAGLWTLAVAVASLVIFKDLARVELFDAGKLLSSAAHARAYLTRRRWSRLAVTFYLIFDVMALVGSFFLVSHAIGEPLSRSQLRITLPLYAATVFVALVMLRTYKTVWARAFLSNYARLAFACFFGSLVGGVAIYYSPAELICGETAFTFAFSTTAFFALLAVRSVRGLVRDFFYAIGAAQLVQRKDVSRVLVYGCGLRYQAFRRELVRSTESNNRIIVGLIDDDLVLRGHYIGGLKVLGTINEAPEIINRLNVDAVVIACEISAEWLKEVRGLLAPTGVKLTHFKFEEQEVK